MEQILNSLLGSTPIAILIGFIVKLGVDRFTKMSDTIEKLKDSQNNDKLQIELLKREIEYLKQQRS